MAKIKLGAIITEATGKLGGQTVSKFGNTVYIKNNVVSSKAASQYQIKRRLTTQYLMSMYSHLSAYQKLLWQAQTDEYEFKDRFGDTQRRNAFQLFQLVNQYRKLTGGSLVVNPLPIHRPTFPLGIDATVKTDEIIVSSALYKSDDIVMVFATKSIQNGVSSVNKFMRFIGYTSPVGGLINEDFTDRYYSVFPNLLEGQSIVFGVKTVSAISGFSNGILISNNQKTLVSPPVPPPFDADAQLYIDAVGGMSQQQKNNLTIHVMALKNSGLWAKLKAIYPFFGTTAAQHKFNLKNPLDTNAAFRLVFFGGVVHGEQFIEGNGTNAYADSFYNPLSQATLNSESITLQARKQLTSGVNTRVEVGATTTPGNQKQASYLQVDTPEFYTVMNATNASNIGLNAPVYPDKRHVYTATKNGTSTLRAYVDGFQVASGVFGSSRPNNSLYLLNVNVAATPYSLGYSAQKLGYVAFGSGLSASEVQTLHAIIAELNPQ